MKKLVKKVIPVLSGIILASSPAGAQSNLIAGIKGGVGCTTLYSVSGNSNKPYYRYKTGFTMPYGLFSSWQFSQSFSICADIGYALTGGSTKDIHPLKSHQNVTTPYGQLFADCLSETKLYFVSTSVMLRYNYKIGSNGYAFLQAGPSPQFLVRASQLDNGYGTTYKNEDGYSPITGTVYFDEISITTNDFNRWNWAFNWGGGVYWIIDNELVSVSLNASRGLSPIQKNTDADGRHVTALYHLSVGYGLKL